MTKLVVCTAALLLITSSAIAGDLIRAGYEVVLTKGEDTWQASTVVPVEAGLPIQQGLGPYVVSMSVKEDKADKYSLLVRVTGQKGSATENSEFLRHTFDGNHKEQLEFAAAEGGLGLKGVIFVGPPKSAASK
jgi:hypothetical protein